MAARRRQQQEKEDRRQGRPRIPSPSGRGLGREELRMMLAGRMRKLLGSRLTPTLSLERELGYDSAAIGP